MDRVIREVDADLAAEKVVFLWSDVKTKMQRNEASVTRSMYTDLMKYTGRRILSKLEEGEFSHEIWASYCDFFSHAILSYGTSEMCRLLAVAERVLNSVLAYPTRPVPLLKEYLSTAIRQEEQRGKEIQRYLNRPADSQLTAPPLNQLPELEPQNEFTGAIPSYPMELATRLLNEMPEHMTFAHSHCTLYLKLCNPLQIPACGFVGPGYACDTCHIRGLRAAYQAMLYDDEGSDDNTDHDETDTLSENSRTSFDGNATARPTALHEAVRSDAQIAKRTHHGFDMCIACAVFFFYTHRTHLTRTMRSPHPAFEQGRATGVRILCARRIERRRSIDHQYYLQLPPITVAHTDPTCPSDPPSMLSHRASLASQRSRSNGTSPRSPATLPLFRPGTPEKGWGFVNMSCCIAPFGARPIAWVIPTKLESHASSSTTASSASHSLDPVLCLPHNWRERLTVTPKRYAVHHDPAALTIVAAIDDENVLFHPSVIEDVQIAKAQVAAKGIGTSACETVSKSPAKGRTVIAASVATNGPAEVANESCSICLNSLGGSQPVVETTCHHWFHVDCMVDYAAMAENVCPLCRCENALPDMSRDEALSVNEYAIRIRLSPEQLGEDQITVCVGALISRHYRFNNITNIGALRCITLRRGEIKAFEESP